MRNLFFGVLASMMLLTACNGNENAALRSKAEADSLLLKATQDELIGAIDERDQLLTVINEVITDMNEIKGIEKIVTINAGKGEMTDSTQSALTQDLAAIKVTLQQRRERIAALEKQLRNSKTANNELLATLEGLKTQIADQAAQIDLLTSQLNEAHRRIAELDQTVADVTEQRDSFEIEANRQRELANRVFYCIGSKKELKDNDIIEGGGFLKKEKIMQGNFDQEFFTVADRRDALTIPLNSKKAKVLTSQPANSYEIVEVNGQKLLTILKPAEFWGVTNYLVVQID